MNTDQELIEHIVSELHRQPYNMNRLLKVYRLIEVEPHHSVESYAVKAGIPLASMYPIIRTLRAVGLISANGLEPTHSVSSTISFDDIISDVFRKNVQFGLKIQTLANKLAPLRDNEQVPGLGKRTKLEIIEEVRDSILRNEQLDYAILGMEFLSKTCFVSRNFQLFDVPMLTEEPFDEKDYRELLA